MPEYLSPGVYIEDRPGVGSMDAASTSIAGFVGVTQRGKVNTPTYITSWNSFIENFAGGMDSPFMTNSHLAYAVYGFYQNGGKNCYVMRTAGKSAARASSSLSSETPAILIDARDEGTWANGNLKMSITANADDSELFDIVVTYNQDVVERMEGLSNDEGDDFWIDQVNSQSTYITAISGALKVVASVSFSGGEDGLEDITDADYVNSIQYFDVVDDVNLIAVPGQTSETVISGLTSYVDNRGDVFCVIDSPETADTDSVLTLRKKISCKAGELLYPWIKVIDPLSSTGKKRNCPPSGHVIGVIARTITERGVWKTPAGTSANIRGALETTRLLPTGETDRLNPAGVVSIVPKPNAGIVVWGARSLSPDKSMKYVSDILLDNYIKKTTYNNTQQFVFEPNSPETWSKVVSLLEGFLDTLWRDGGLYGSSASEAYFVKCDADLNTEAVRAQGRMITEVGYASKKPAEFVIFRFSHDMANQ